MSEIHEILKSLLASYATVSIEDTGHFLLCGLLYYNHRQEMLISVCQPTINVLLYGVDNLSFNDKKQIFDAVHDFL